ncbi:flavoprotein [Clostridium acetobutylicum]|nr:flavoprotein [Clostridium acetobutylicum]
MPRKKLPCFVGLPYKDHKQRVQLTKKYLKDYYVSDLGGILYMERRYPNGI